MKRIFHSLTTVALLGLSSASAVASNWDAHWSFAGHGNDNFNGAHHGAFPLSGTGSFEFGKLNQALYYDILKVDSLSIQKAAEPFSLSFWALRETRDYAETLFSKQQSPFSAGMSVSLDGANAIVVDIRNGQGGSIKIKSQQVWTDMNDWHHLVVTYNGSIQAGGISLYLDNQRLDVDVISDNLTGDIGASDPVVIGADSETSYATFNGAIDEVYLGSRAFNSSDIECLYALRDNCVDPISDEPPVIAPQGPRGFEGPAGPQGLRGATGSQGVKGAKGPIGDPGVKGPQGSQGSKGDLGLKGLTGITGNPGIDGRNGRDGKDGNAGLMGLQGPDGLQGPKGVRGDTGPMGPQGDPGPQGLKGPTGAKGVTGATGDAGPQGYAGAAGVVGADGTQGAKGDKGLTGATGPTGQKGATGQKGGPGDRGPHGVVIKGPKGAEGDPGARGPQGYSRYYQEGFSNFSTELAESSTKELSPVELYKAMKAEQTIQDGAIK
ncbi:Collagen triple helix repeat [Shewanella denitrificans OS217]|uniref:Collagen triple helix repeat n=1 Tax=Shewanella denitrificans (strain OS217 / ATCC BAA-1090 / DSM 15013) TaxID=318161 RepID=Q12MW8_SHEDO|nr:LamG-like jellyroll fold domain-containing protein [Shewanella denitrificans]ABE55208.1 Collagen triple helix repeat [Shewanella denitrificans OS217]